MKKLFLLLLAILMVISFAACGGEDEQPVFANEASSGANTAVAQPGSSELYTDELDNGLKIVIYADGVMEISGADVQENFHDRSILKDYLNNVTALKIKDGVGEICEKGFSGFDKLKKVYTGSVETVGYYAFSGCTALVDVTLGDCVREIGDYAFNDCTALKDIRLEDNVRSVGSYAFNGCTALKNARFGSGIEKMGSNIFQGCTAFTSFRTGSDICENAFNGNTSIASVEIDEGAENIGSQAFLGCTALRSVSFPATLKSIGNSAFSGCTVLGNVSFTGCEDVTLGTSCFQGCTALSAITVSDCKNFTIGNSAFLKCTALASLDFQNSRRIIIGESGFSGCTGFISLHLAEGVQRINDNAFTDCTSLEKFIIPVSCERLGYGILQNTSKLRTVGYCGTAPQWNVMISKGDLKFATNAGYGGVMPSVKHNYKE